jgi:hypothetical protein
MARLKNKWQCIPDGFWFLDAPISDQAMGPYWDYNLMLQEVQKRRQLNPRFGLPTDLPTIDAEAERQNAQRMLERRNCESYVIQDGLAPPNFPVPRGHGWPSAAGVKRVAAGAATLLEWLGAGGQPVPGEQSDSRAGVCATCPQNQAGDWTTLFTAAAAAAIQKQLDSRRELKLATPHDDQLKVCAACSCPLELKVHVPIKHISARMSAETRARLDPRCWILKETTV